MFKTMETLRKAMEALEARLLDWMPSLWFGVSHYIPMVPIVVLAFFGAFVFYFHGFYSFPVCSIFL